MDLIISELWKRADQLNKRFKVLSPSLEVFFDKPNLLFPAEVRTAAHKFEKLSSWLYVLVIECSGYNLNFVRKKAINLGHEKSTFPDFIAVLRTRLQHNLNENKIEDLNKINTCNSWFTKVCKEPNPSSDNMWNLCLDALLNEANDFMNYLDNILRAIESDEFKIQIIIEWESTALKHRKKYEFEKVLSKKLEEWGCKNLVNTNAFCSKYYDQWQKRIYLYNNEYDFDEVATKMIIGDLANENMLPLNGEDIIKEFNLSGPAIGNALRLAKSIFENSPCNKDELIKKLREEIKA